MMTVQELFDGLQAAGLQDAYSQVGGGAEAGAMAGGAAAA